MDDRDMTVIATPEHFSLAQICRSGQCFRMEQIKEDRFRILASDRILEAEQSGGESRFFCEREEFESFWKPYFDLECDYGSYIDRIDREDLYLKQAADFGGGIRILRQDLWETIVSFLISQQNNIPRIKRCIQNICDCYGEHKVSGSGVAYSAFPRPEALAVLEEDALKECNLGYRSKYVVRAARAVASGAFDCGTVSRMPRGKAREELLKLYGVGAKVADCICLFALHDLDAFPIDTHISQVMQQHYQTGFPKERYAGFEGVVQQYIFYFELFGSKEEKEK